MPEEVATAVGASGVRTPPALALSRFGVCVIGALDTPLRFVGLAGFAGVRVVGATDPCGIL